jgi:acetyl-CoA C-acetyltransferase
MGIGPAYAIPEALKKAGLSFADIGYWEVHEAFAAQFLGVEHLLAKEHGCKLNMDIVNRNGSGISLGHPVGCSGLRVVVSLLHEMERTGAALGCASLCAGGGPAMATVIELMN